MRALLTERLDRYLAQAGRWQNCEHALSALVVTEHGSGAVHEQLIAHAAEWAVAASPGTAVVSAPVGSVDVVREAVAEIEIEVIETQAVPISELAEQVFERHGGPLILVRSDLFTLRPAHWQATWDDLASGCDATVGPATAGGWYMLGLSAPHVDLIDGDDVQLGISMADGLSIGFLRTERRLRQAGDFDAARADPLTPAPIRAVLG